MVLKCSLSGQISFMLLPVLFPGLSRDAAGAARPLGVPSVCMGVCVFVRVCVRARSRVFYYGCAQKQAAPAEALWRTESQDCQSPHLALVSDSGGEGRGKSVCVCLVARPACVCPRSHEWVGPGWQLPDAHQDSSLIFAKALPLCCLSEGQETSKGRVPVIFMQIHHT